MLPAEFAAIASYLARTREVSPPEDRSDDPAEFADPTFNRFVCIFEAINISKSIFKISIFSAQSILMEYAVLIAIEQFMAGMKAD